MSARASECEPGEQHKRCGVKQEHLLMVPSSALTEAPQGFLSRVGSKAPEMHETGLSCSGFTK